jgi:hypothetical protein
LRAITKIPSLKGIKFLLGVWATLILCFIGTTDAGISRISFDYFLGIGKKKLTDIGLWFSVPGMRNTNC